jgi:hypothetical protein
VGHHTACNRSREHAGQLAALHHGRLMIHVRKAGSALVPRFGEDYVGASQRNCRCEPRPGRLGLGGGRCSRGPARPHAAGPGGDAAEAGLGLVGGPKALQLGVGHCIDGAAEVCGQLSEPCGGWDE